jgi:hypothetical protein
VQQAYRTYIVGACPVVPQLLELARGSRTSVTVQLPVNFLWHLVIGSWYIPAESACTDSIIEAGFARTAGNSRVETVETSSHAQLTTDETNRLGRLRRLH